MYQWYAVSDCSRCISSPHLLLPSYWPSRGWHSPSSPETWPCVSAVQDVESGSSRNGGITTPWHADVSTVACRSMKTQLHRDTCCNIAISLIDPKSARFSMSAISMEHEGGNAERNREAKLSPTALSSLPQSTSYVL